MRRSESIRTIWVCARPGPLVCAHGLDVEFRLPSQLPFGRLGRGPHGLRVTGPTFRQVERHLEPTGLLKGVHHLEHGGSVARSQVVGDATQL